jgi:hypothetical protein
MKDKQWYKRWWIWIISITVVVFPFIINEAYKLNSGYGTLWNAADALSYFGSFLGAAGTIILGIVAWQQNKRLLRIEENSFIASNACIGFVNQVTINDIKQKACNFELHDEQIVSTIKKIDSFKDYSSYSIQISMQIKENSVALVKINEVLLVASKAENQISPLSFYSIDDKYSRTAIYQEGTMFNVTMIVTQEEKNEFIRTIAEIGSQLFMEIDFTLLTDKYVSSHLKCRSTLLCNSYSEKEGVYNDFQIDNNIKPICFWYGNDILERSLIKIKCITKKSDE